MVFSHLKNTCIPFFAQAFLKLPLRPLVYSTAIYVLVWGVWYSSDCGCFFLFTGIAWELLLIFILFKAHMGYLHLSSTSGGCQPIKTQYT